MDIKIRKSNLNLNCDEMGSQRMNSRNVTDIIEGEVKVNKMRISSLSVKDRKEKKKNGWTGQRKLCHYTIFD